MYPATVASHPFANTATSATVLTMVSKSITNRCGNNSFLQIFFQAISIPLEFHGEDAALAYNTLNGDLAAENINDPLHQRKA